MMHVVTVDGNISRIIRHPTSTTLVNSHSLDDADLPLGNIPQGQGDPSDPRDADADAGA